MKICYISDFYPPFVAGGAETYLSRLVKSISKNFEVTVITTIPFSKGLQEQTIKGNIKIYRFSIKPLYSLLDFTKRSLFSNGLWQICNLWNLHSFERVVKLLAKERPDIVHTHNFKALSSSVFSAVHSGNYPHIHTIHDYNLLNPHSNLWRQRKIIKTFNTIDISYMNYMKQISRNTDLAIFPSTFSMQLHKSKGFFQNNRVEVLHNGLPLTRAIISPKNYDNQIHLLYVGNLTYYKGVHVLINAFKQCDSPRLTLDIVGVGEENIRLRSLAAGNTRIAFHGRASEKLLKELYMKSNLLVFPSLWYEVLPVVIQEALSYGTPVIASSLGGAVDLVSDGYNGFLFEPGNVLALKEIFTKVYHNPTILNDLSSNSLAFSQKFDMGKHVKKIIQLYKETLDERRKQEIKKLVS